MKLVLASASPRRSELLLQMGLDFEIKAVDIDETPMADEEPRAYVSRLALAKAQAAGKFYQLNNVLILGSDTAVIIGNEILGKPVDKEHAHDMLMKLSGKTHTVLTSVALLGAKERCIVSKNEVTFSTITDVDFEEYWATGESNGKAGAYAIQGKAALFIKRIEGSFSGVMGLPIFETNQLLKDAGFYPA
jgi:septum formation protein